MNYHLHPAYDLRNANLAQRRVLMFVYSNRREALTAAAKAGLFPVTERYDVGITTIYISPDGVKSPQEICEIYSAGIYLGKYVPA